MLFVHETQESLPGKGRELEDAYRWELMPRLAENGDARLLWYTEMAQGVSASRQVITVTAFRDIEAWERTAARLETGDLAPWLRKVDQLRVDLYGRMLLPVDWSPAMEVDLGSVPVDPNVTHEQSLWLISLSHPYGDLDDYHEFQYTKWYLPLLDGTARLRLKIDLQFFFEVAGGAGPRPEFFFWEKITDEHRNIVHTLLSTELPPEMSTPDAYNVDGLRVRDQWENQILRASSWSPRY